MTPQQKLEEAETALHELSLGKRVVEIGRGGKTLKFTAASMSDLRRYINELKQQISGTQRRPMRVSL